MESSEQWIGVVLDPLDTLFFRDGRPFDAASRVQSGLPTPQTLAGALRTVMLTRTGFPFERFRAPKSGPLEDALLQAGASPEVVTSRFRGPFLALADSQGAIEPLFPLPTVLSPAKRQAEGWSWARPKDLPHWNDSDGLMPLAREVDADPKSGSRLITLEGLKAFLDARPPDPDSTIETASLYQHDYRVGIGIDYDRLTSAEGQIYAIGLLSLAKKWPDGRRLVVYAEVNAGGSALDVAATLDGIPIPFGGEGRVVEASTVPALRWPEADRSLDRSVWYLASPSFLPRSQNGRPLPASSAVKAASSAVGFAVSGWDILRRCPRATRFAIPAGATYFLEGAGSTEDFLDATLPDARNLRQEGWGFALQGRWKD